MYLFNFSDDCVPSRAHSFTCIGAHPFRNGFLTCAIFFKYNCISQLPNFLTMVPTLVYHFPSSLCPPCPICSPFATCAISHQQSCLYSTFNFFGSVPTRADYFPCLGAHPLRRHMFSGLQPPYYPVHPGLQAGALPFFPVLAPTRTKFFFDSMPTRAYYFPCLDAHPCANDTCSLGCSRRTTRTPWTTGWSTSIFSCVSAHPH